MSARRWFGAAALLVVLAAGAPHVGAQTPSVARKPDSPLSPRLEALAGGSALDGLPAGGPGSLLRDGDGDGDGDGSILVEIRVGAADAATLGALKRAGAHITHVAARYRSVTAWVAPDRLLALATTPGVEFAEEVLHPVNNRVGQGVCAPLVTEGDAQLDADLARAQFGVDGSGIAVGVLSDSYDRNPDDDTDEADDVTSGNIPGGTNPCARRQPSGPVADSDTAGGDEGRGMAQIIHDVVPGAQISFASAFGGVHEFADNIRALRVTGADVIVDDVTYLSEPFYQDGPISVAVNEVTADGATYFSSAGNSTFAVGGRNVASYEARSYRPAACPAGLPAFAGPDCHDFDPSAAADAGSGFVMAGQAQVTLVLQWAEPWYGVATDLDVYLVDRATDEVVARSATLQSRSGAPAETLVWTNRSATRRAVDLVVNRYSGASSPRVRFVHVFTIGLDDVEYDRSSGPDTVGPSIVGHNGAQKAVTVGAVPYHDSSTAEPFTSQGPVTVLFGPVASAAFPAAPLPKPKVLTKPDIAATDGGQNTFFGVFDADDGVWRFYGTSAAAPHAAAVAALGLSLRPDASPDDLGRALRATARPVASASAVQVGAGLVDADAFLTHLA